MKTKKEITLTLDDQDIHRMTHIVCQALLTYDKLIRSDAHDNVIARETQGMCLSHDDLKNVRQFADSLREDL